MITPSLLSASLSLLNRSASQTYLCIQMSVNHHCRIFPLKSHFFHSFLSLHRQRKGAVYFNSRIEATETMRVVVILFWFAAAVYAMTCDKGTQVFRHELNTGPAASVSGALESTVVPTLVHCIFKCANHPSCMSTFWRPSKLAANCAIYDAISGPEDHVFEDGSIFISRKNRSEASPGELKSNDECQMSEVHAR